MGAITSLLGIVDIKKADGLILETGAVPALLVGGDSMPLTMPPLSPSVVQGALDELLTPALRATLDGTGEVEAMHAAGSVGTFVVHVRAAGDRMTITLRRGVARLAPAAEPQPLAAVASAAHVPESGSESDDGLLGAVLAEAIARRASDVLLSPGIRAMLRVHGRWTEADGPAAGDVEQAFAAQLTEERRRLLADTGSVDLAFGHVDPATGDEVRFRVNLFRQHTGVAAALRPLWTALSGLADLNLPAALLPIINVPHGLVLMSGATGSGKSTTLAALIEHLNRERACHVVTLEDPIEYVFRPRRAVIHQREVGTHVDGFASGLRAALRESPDVILVGEMRDRDTIRLALTAAETGHLVMSTLHSGTAALAIDRVIDAFDDADKLEVRQQLAGALRYVFAQQLVPTPRGDRIPVLEMLTVTNAVAAQIREGRTHMLAAQMDVEAGDRMVSMERALADLVRAGRIARQTALEASQRPDEVRRLLDDRPATAKR